MRPNYQTEKRLTCHVKVKDDFRSKFTLIRSLSLQSLGHPPARDIKESRAFEFTCADMGDEGESRTDGERGRRAAAFVSAKTC